MQQQLVPPGRTARFGSFEAHLGEHKLSKMGVRIRLQEQPFRILVLLLGRPGQLVTREEIREQAWPENTFLDFDAALNTAIRKLREALSDSADNPRFLETVPRLGYRFLAPVSWSPEVQPDSATSYPRHRNLYLWLAACALILVAAAVAGSWRARYIRARIAPEDTIVLADFINNTSDASFDGALSTALSLSLQQSPYFTAISQGTVARTLRQMRLPEGTKLTADVAREVCQRAGSRAYFAGSIGSLGTSYVLGLKAVNCQSGDILAQEQVTAASKEKVLDALSEATSKLRGELGESLSSVQRFDVPLARATTSSLDALKVYSLGLKAFSERGPSAALPYFQRSVDLDPDFALAYDELGLDYYNLSESGRASEYFSKAFQLRENTSEWERLAITADYYLNVTGELDKAAQTYEQWVESYPKDNEAYASLGVVYATQGDYQKATDATSKALRMVPSLTAYGNLANYALALNHFDEARRIVQEALARKMDAFEFHSVLYGVSFLSQDLKAMAEQQQWFAGKPEENFALALASDTEAYRGRLSEASELTSRAVESAIRADDKESGAIWLANAALRQAAYGNAVEARQTAAKALKLAPASQGTEAEAALAFAMAGDAARAEPLAQDLGRRFPLDTQIHSLWLPAIQTQLALDRQDRDYIVKAPQSVSPVEYGTILFVANSSCLYPTYIRGQAFLAAGQGTQAAAEFQKIIDHSGIVWNCWTGALAHLGVARAKALEEKTFQRADADAARVRAFAAYKDFLTLWKDADFDIPILKQAKAEYAKLQ